jgi:DNA polymerase/3'-5' exonuclease PolX
MKTRWPRAAAVQVARELCDALRPVTDRLIVAGSLRRRKSEVGDVEIIFVPHFENRQLDMFSTAPMNLAEERLAALLTDGTLSKRPSATGGFAWGPKNKLALHRSGIPVDLFTATEANWWNYLVCRTGPADSNTAICMAARERGYKWNPYGEGFTRQSDGEIIPVDSEAAVFRFVGLEPSPWSEK